MIVWVVGTDSRSGAGDNRLHGYDGDSGTVIYDGGGTNELMAGTHSYSTTGIVARGRIYVATDNKVYAFKLPGGAPTPLRLQAPQRPYPTDSNIDSYADTDRHAHPERNANCDTHSYSDFHSNANCHAFSDAIANPNAWCNTDSYTANGTPSVHQQELLQLHQRPQLVPG